MIGRIILEVVIDAGIGSIMGYFGKRSTDVCPLTSNPYNGAIYDPIFGN